MESEIVEHSADEDNMSAKCKIRVGFYLENKAIPSVIFCDPKLGNPGCGGTEFLFFSVPYSIETIGGHDIEPVLLANHVENISSILESHKVKDIVDAAIKAVAVGCDIFVYRPHRKCDFDFMNTIEELELKSVAWAHVTPDDNHLRSLAKSPFVKAFVCVGREQHDHLRDTALQSKLTYIFNPVYYGISSAPSHFGKDKNLIVYMGSIVPQKGFHMLARAWPEIISRYPNAKLSVIGTGALYNQESSLGPYGLAEREYEESFISFLTDRESKILPSVKFHGRLGSEKSAILSKALVGVANPTGSSETFCLSAAELSLEGVAVVSARKNGLLDTVLDKKTGLLGRGERDLVDNICKLISNPEMAIEYGSNGKSFVKAKFRYDQIAKDWILLLKDLAIDKKPKTVPFKSNLLSDFKWLVFLNAFLQSFFGKFIFWPSVLEARKFLIRFLVFFGFRKEVNG